MYIYIYIDIDIDIDLDMDIDIDKDIDMSVDELFQVCFQQCLVTWTAPRHDLNKCWLTDSWILLNKI